MVYILRLNESLNCQDVSTHLAAFALRYNADSLLCVISRLVTLQCVVLAIAAVNQVLRSIVMLIYVHQVAITLEG